MKFHPWNVGEATDLEHCNANHVDDGVGESMLNHLDVPLRDVN